MRRAGAPSRWTVLAVLAGAVPAAFLLLFFVLPVAGMLQRGFVVDGRLDLAGAWETLARPRMARVVWFTLWSSTVATALTVLLGVPAAYVLHRLRFPGQRVLRGLVAVPFVLPTVVVGVAFRTLLADGAPLGGLGLDGTPVAILLALVFFNVSVVIRTVGPWWESLDPRRAEAAAALGATPWQVARTVTLPALAPAVVSSASVVFLFCATAFGVVLTLGGVRYATVETEIYLLTTQFLDLRAAAALSVLQIVVVVGLLAAAARGRSRVIATARTPQRLVARTPRPRDLPAFAVFAVTLVLVLAPLSTLVLRSLRGPSGFTLDNYRHLVTRGDDAIARVPLDAALATSLRVAVDATTLALVLGGIVAVLVTRPVTRPGLRRVAAAFDGAFMLPLGVSAVTVGFGLLVTLDRPPFDVRGEPWLVPVAQAMVALPLVVRVLVPPLSGVDPRQRDAAASLGASPLAVLRDIDLPVVWRPLLAAAGFAFAVSLGEFGATSFLARPDEPTLPVLIYQLVGRPGGENFGAALAASVVLAGVTTMLVLAVDRLRVPGLGSF